MVFRSTFKDNVENRTLQFWPTGSAGGKEGEF